MRTFAAPFEKRFSKFIEKTELLYKKQVPINNISRSVDSFEELHIKVSVTS